MAMHGVRNYFCFHFVKYYLFLVTAITIMRSMFFYEPIFCAVSHFDIPDKPELSLCKVWVQ
jgi:hypothetical protein